MHHWYVGVLARYYLLGCFAGEHPLSVRNAILVQSADGQYSPSTSLAPRVRDLDLGVLEQAEVALAASEYGRSARRVRATVQSCHRHAATPPPSAAPAQSAEPSLMQRFGFQSAHCIMSHSGSHPLSLPALSPLSQRLDRASKGGATHILKKKTADAQIRARTSTQKATGAM
jgi:hypothetical protein